MNTVQEFHDRCVNVEEINLLDFRSVIGELLPLEQCPQDPGWHGEGNVLIHTNMVMAEARALCLQLSDPWERTSLHIAALLHDVGKPGTTFKNQKNGGRVVAFGHEEYGVHIARDFLKKYFPEFSYAQREEILSLVEFHGHPKRLTNGESSVARFKRLSLEVPTKKVYNLEIADYMGRIAKDKHLAVQVIESFKQRCEEIGIFGREYSFPGIDNLPPQARKTVLWWVLFHHVHDNDPKVAEDAVGRLRDPFKLIIPVGCPASGKTTNRPTDIRTISLDDMRTKLLGTPNDMSKNQEVYDMCYKELVKSIKAHESVYWDATSWSRKSRKRLIDLARTHGATIELVHYDLSLPTLLERNTNREKKVNEDVVIKFYQQIQTPKSYEYDNLIVIE